MELELAKEKINLIKKIIVSDKKYIDNEDLFDDFLNETCKRSFLIMKTINNPSSLETYLRKIVTTSIVEVLKNSGRVRRTQEGFIKTQEQSLDQLVSEPENKYSNVKINYDIVDLRESPEETVIKKELLQKLYDAVLLAHNSNPLKQYMQLYNLRYIQSLKQKQIAQELNLSQSEVSKRLLELMEEVKSAFDNG